MTMRYWFDSTSLRQGNRLGLFDLVNFGQPHTVLQTVGLQTVDPQVDLQSATLWLANLQQSGILQWNVEQSDRQSNQFAQEQAAEAESGWICLLGSRDPFAHRFDLSHAGHQLEGQIDKLRSGQPSGRYSSFR
jgi:hypothetical protein